MGKPQSQADLPPEFTKAELAKCGRFSDRQSAFALRALMSLGLCERCGSRGKAYLYRLTETA